jgi:hypothetical protein
MCNVSVDGHWSLEIVDIDSTELQDHLKNGGLVTYQDGQIFD